MQNYKIEQISRKTEVSPRTQREYEKIGLKIDGEWCNGFGRRGVTDNWEAGMEITGVRIVDKEYQGKLYKNWEFISNEDRLAKLEAEVEKLKEILSGPKGHTGPTGEKISERTSEKVTDPIDDLPF